MAESMAADESFWTLIVAGIPKADKPGQDEPLIEELIKGVNPVLICHHPLMTSVLYVVVKGASAAFEAQEWLYKRKLKGKYEISSGVVGSVGFATGMSGNFGKNWRYRSPDLTDEMWLQAGVAEANAARSADPTATPTTTGGPSSDHIFPLSPSSSSAPAGPAQSQVAVVRSGKNSMAREVQDENLERQIKLKREEQEALKTEIEQLYAGLETSDMREILHAESLRVECLVVMRNILRERIGSTGPDSQAAPAREPSQQDA